MSYVHMMLAMLLWSTAEGVTRTVICRITPVQFAVARFTIGVLVAVTACRYRVA